jgi:hypothetical protein
VAQASACGHRGLLRPASGDTACWARHRATPPAPPATGRHRLLRAASGDTCGRPARMRGEVPQGGSGLWSILGATGMATRCAWRWPGIVTLAGETACPTVLPARPGCWSQTNEERISLSVNKMWAACRGGASLGVHSVGGEKVLAWREWSPDCLLSSTALVGMVIRGGHFVFW